MSQFKCAWALLESLRIVVEVSTVEIWKQACNCRGERMNGFGFGGGLGCRSGRRTGGLGPERRPGKKLIGMHGRRMLKEMLII